MCIHSHCGKVKVDFMQLYITNYVGNMETKEAGSGKQTPWFFFFFWWVSGTELRTLFFPGRCYTSQISLPQTMIFDRVIVPFRIMVVQGECKINQWEFRRNTIRAQFILSCNSSMFHQKHTCFLCCQIGSVEISLILLTLVWSQF